jgi:hypothetical protein
MDAVREVGAPGAPVHDVGDRRKKEVRPPTGRQYPAGSWDAPRKVTGKASIAWRPAPVAIFCIDAETSIDTVKKMIGCVSQFCHSIHAQQIPETK